MDKMLKKNYDYFNANLEQLLSQYKGRYIAIKEETVIGDYNSFEDAYNNLCEKEEIGTFIIQHCISEAEQYRMNFAWNNVSFEGVLNQ